MRHHHPARRRHKDDERGASLVEYALLLALIAVVCFSAVSFFGSSSKAGFGHSQDCIQRAYSNQAPCPAGG
ncbi:MAG: Flp family type IVb pilin [Aquihabitans sp.]